MSARKDVRSELNMMKHKNTIVKNQTLMIQNRIEGDCPTDTISDIFDISHRNEIVVYLSNVSRRIFTLFDPIVKSIYFLETFL